MNLTQLFINLRVVRPAEQVVHGAVQVVSQSVYFINRRYLPFFHIIKNAFIQVCI